MFIIMNILDDDHHTFRFSNIDPLTREEVHHAND